MMNKAWKRYKLFGMTVWEVEACSETDEPEVVEEETEEDVATSDLNSSHTLAGSETPMLGFVDWKNWPFGDDEE